MKKKTIGKEYIFTALILFVAVSYTHLTLPTRIKV